MSDGILVMRKQLLGEIARWAVQQSPYHCPDGLPDVLAEVSRRFHVPWPCMVNGSETPLEIVVGKPGDVAMVKVTLEHWYIQEWLRGLLFDQVQVKAWNARKNGRDGPGFSSRFGSDANGPDDDFIDLDALVQNVASALIKSDRELHNEKS